MNNKTPDTSRAGEDPGAHIPGTGSRISAGMGKVSSPAAGASDALAETLATATVGLLD